METLDKPLTEEDIALFLDTLSDEPMKCEARHAENGNACSIEVTHRERLTCCGIVRNVCTAEANDSMSDRHRPCAHCMRPLGTCWIITPI